MPIELREGSEVVFGGSSRSHVVRLAEIDLLARLAAQKAELDREIAALETDAKDEKNLFGLLPQAKRLNPLQTTCFVGNLPYDATAEALTDWLRERGFDSVSSIRLPTDRETGAPKGIAFVDFADAEIAHKALQLGGETFESRTLKVPRPSPAPLALPSRSAPLGPARPSSAQLGPARPSSAQLGPARPHARTRTPMAAVPPIPAPYY